MQNNVICSLQVEKHQLEDNSIVHYGKVTMAHGCHVAVVANLSILCCETLENCMPTPAKQQDE